MFKTRLKLYIAIILAVLASGLLGPFIRPAKHNKHIPVEPIALNIALFQNEAMLGLKSVSLVNTYPSDYQSEFASNYYLITILNGDKTLFTGKTIRSYIIISDDFSGDEATGAISEVGLGDFELNLPYYKDATMVVIADETGRQVLDINLTDYLLSPPSTATRSCGDGVCADGENLLMCAADCSFRIKQ